MFAQKIKCTQKFVTRKSQINGEHIFSKTLDMTNVFFLCTSLYYYNLHQYLYIILWRIQFIGMRNEKEFKKLKTPVLKQLFCQHRVMTVHGHWIRPRKMDTSKLALNRNAITYRIKVILPMRILSRQPRFVWLVKFFQRTLILNCNW